MLLQWFKGKPIWVLGAGVAGTWVALDVAQSVLAGLGDWLPLGLAAAGTGIWLAGRKRSPKVVLPATVGLGRSQVEKLLHITQGRLEILAVESEKDGVMIAEWRSGLDKISADLEWRETATGRSLAVLGGRSTGKSTLTQVLPQEMGGSKLEWTELPSLFEDCHTDQQAIRRPRKSYLECAPMLRALQYRTGTQLPLSRSTAL